MFWPRESITTLDITKIKLLIKTLPEFDQKVLMKVLEIPWGETRSYKWLANAVGKPTSVRQVARVLSRNPYPIIIPCHRVIRSDGSIGGYILGSNIKRFLLDLEKRVKSVIISKEVEKITVTARRKNAGTTGRKNS